jgi:hypothetical protein
MRDESICASQLRVRAKVITFFFEKEDGVFLAHGTHAYYIISEDIKHKIVISINVSKMISTTNYTHMLQSINGTSHL